MFTKVVKLTYKGQDGLGLSGEDRQGKIWVGLSSVMSEEAHIPPAPGCEAAQPNHANPSLTPNFGRGEHFYPKCTKPICHIVFGSNE